MKIVVRKSLRLQLREKKEMLENMEKQLRGTKDHLRCSNELLIRGSVQKNRANGQQNCNLPELCKDMGPLIQGILPRTEEDQAKKSKHPGTGVAVRPTEPSSAAPEARARAVTAPVGDERPCQEGILSAAKLSSLSKNRVKTDLGSQGARWETCLW